MKAIRQPIVSQCVQAVWVATGNRQVAKIVAVGKGIKICYDDKNSILGQSGKQRLSRSEKGVA